VFYPVLYALMYVASWFFSHHLAFLFKCQPHFHCPGSLRSIGAWDMWFPVLLPWLIPTHSTCHFLQKSCLGPWSIAHLCFPVSETSFTWWQLFICMLCEPHWTKCVYFTYVVMPYVYYGLGTKWKLGKCCCKRYVSCCYYEIRTEFESHFRVEIEACNIS
jgi:hypothetical protein